MSLHRNTLADRAQRAAGVASRHADVVDRVGRFPFEAVEALRAERLLGAFLPQEYGGEALCPADAAHVCARLAQACGASAGLFALHQASLAGLARQARGEADFALLRRIAWEQALVVTGNGPETAIETIGAGSIADARAETFGLRGLVAGVEGILACDRAGPALEIAGPFAAARDLLWSAWCCGVGAAALRRAENFVSHASREACRPSGAPDLARAAADLQAMRAQTREALRRHEGQADLPHADLAGGARREAADWLAGILRQALAICGAEGAAEHGPHSLSRLARDAACELALRGGNDGGARRRAMRHAPEGSSRAEEGLG